MIKDVFLYPSNGSGSSTMAWLCESLEWMNVDLKVIGMNDRHVIGTMMVGLTGTATTSGPVRCMTRRC